MTDPTSPALLASLLAMAARAEVDARAHGAAARDDVEGHHERMACLSATRAARHGRHALTLREAATRLAAVSRVADGLEVAFNETMAEMLAHPFDIDRLGQRSNAYCRAVTEIREALNGEGEEG